MDRAGSPWQVIRAARRRNWRLAGEASSKTPDAIEGRAAPPIGTPHPPDAATGSPPTSRARPALATLAGLLWLSAGTAGCELAVRSFSAEARETWTRTYTLDAGGRFELQNVNGAIAIEASRDGRVHVRADRIARSGTEAAARELLGRLEIVETVEPALRLETRAPRRGLLERGATEVRYVVEVPEAVAVRVRNTNGRITLADLAGRVVADTTNGGVSGLGLRGPVEASTTNGGIEMDLAAVAAEGVTLETTNGGIRLALPSDARADISARVTNGGIDSGRLAVEALEMSRRRLEGRLNGGGPAIRLETTNGGIRLSAR
jgi:hypothetical protein